MFIKHVIVFSKLVNNMF